ncbi:MAG: iron ABC transporter permease [Lachnospiraceae bacterium]|nr:iron ABC transporter permease [Lachnospiraceae bacterium]
MKEKKKICKDPFTLLLIFTSLVVVSVFIVYPLFCILKSSIYYQGVFSFDTYMDTLSGSGFKIAFVNSMKLGFATAVTATITGFLFAYVDACVSSPFKKLYNVTSIVPVISPPFVLSLSAILLLGKRGLITYNFLGIKNANIYGFGGLLLVQTLAFFPVSAMMFKGMINNIDSSLEEASRNMGASRLKSFMTITLPLLLPGFANSFMLSFIESITDYSNPMIIGGGYKTLASQIYVQAIGNYKLQVGTTIAVILLMVTVFVFLLQRWLLSKKTFVTLTGKATRERQMIKEKSVVIPLNIICMLFTLCIWLFYAFLILGSFFKMWGIDYSMCLDNFIYVLTYSMDALRDSTIISLLAAPISGVFAMIVAYLVVRKKFRGKLYLEQASLLGLAVPGTVFGLGYILAFNNKPLLLTNTLAILVIVLAMTRLPVGVRSGIASLQQIDPSIEEAGRNLGASSNKVFWSITIPLIKSSFFSGLIFTFIKSMTSISAVIFLVSSRYNLLTVRMMTYVDKGRFGYAAACATLLIVVVFAVVGIVWKFLSKMGISTEDVMSNI